MKAYIPSDQFETVIHVFALSESLQVLTGLSQLLLGHLQTAISF